MHLRVSSNELAGVVDLCLTTELQLRSPASLVVAPLPPILILQNCAALQDAQPRVAFAVAAAIAAAVEGSADAAEAVAEHGGVLALVAALRSGGGYGKKAAAEAIMVRILHPGPRSHQLPCTLIHPDPPRCIGSHALSIDRTPGTSVEASGLIRMLLNVVVEALQAGNYGANACC